MIGHTWISVIVAMAGLFCIGSCGDAVLGPEPENTPEGNFETLWGEFDRYYAQFDAKKVNWDSLYAVYRPRVRDDMSDQELFDLMSELLANLNDGHVNLQTSFASFNADTAVDDSSAPFEGGIVLYNYLNGTFDTAGDGMLGYGRLPGDIGYIRIPSFAGGTDRDPGITRWVDDLDIIIASFEGVAGVIIDVRDNNGGNSYNADYIAGRFADQARIYLTISSRSGRNHEEFTPPYERFIAPRGPRQFRGPVVLLTNGGSISGAEWFTLAMRELPYVTVVGDTTSGNFSGSMKRELPNGWIYTIAVQRVLANGGISHEGKGIPPDVSITTTRSDIAAGRDPVLEAAIAHLKR